MRMISRWCLKVILVILAVIFVFEVYRRHIQVQEPENLELKMSFYEYYGGSKVSSRLVPDGENFHLNGIPLRILSGTIHYFRVHPDYWRDRLRKLRAAGLNTVDTYVPWNLHEAKNGLFDFGQGGDDWSAFLDLEKFIQIVKEEDLFLILRPGPYICAEWDFGGMPSYLLRDPEMEVRSTYPGYLSRAVRFIEKVANLAGPYQFSQEYGAQPIIMVQVENEFGSLGVERQDYLKALDDAFTTGGFRYALHFTSDSIYHTKDLGMIPGVFRTVNTKERFSDELNTLSLEQPNMPLMVTEFWTGWFDSWLKPFHNHDNIAKFMQYVISILERGASIGLYMFHGGTNFGFFNGAIDLEAGYQPHVTSYDYGAPLSENGDYTDNYWALKNYLLEKYAIDGVVYPKPPPHVPPVSYPDCRMTEYLTVEDLVSQSIYETSDHLTGKYMETLSINDGNGQSFGFTAYTCASQLKTKRNSLLEMKGSIHDIAYVLVDGILLTSWPRSSDDLQISGYWTIGDPKFSLRMFKDKEVNLTILVENMGRVNYGSPRNFLQRKGLGSGEVTVDSKAVGPWKITPLEFKSSWLKSLKRWKQVSNKLEGPHLLRGVFSGHKNKDTFIHMRQEGETVWIKGQVFINGFNLGRYWNIGPTKTLYVPGPLVLEGRNEIMIFELYRPGESAHFTDKPNLGPSA